jgi:DNA processing protein
MASDAEYPAALRDLRHPPKQLFVAGSTAVLHRPVVAIVGTRRSTAYGERIARELSTAVARAGGCVLSGMARGIDAVAHHAALKAGGATAAVLGTGVDIPYPVGHRPLHESIARNGLLLSEFPPGRTAMPGSFPRRNRLIAALARVTIVVEAPERSGALGTATEALHLDRDVAAVPGPIDVPQSAGSNQLLRDGAQVITSVEDALTLAGLERGSTLRPRDLRPDEERLWSALAEGALDPDALAARSGLPARRCLAAIATLELAGLVQCDLTGTIRRRG